MNISKTFFDKTRHDIIILLSQGEMSAGEIASNFDASWPNVSQHLSVLKDQGFVNSRKEGQFVYYSLNKDRLCQIIFRILDNAKLTIADLQEYESTHDMKKELANLQEYELTNDIKKESKDLKQNIYQGE